MRKVTRSKRALALALSASLAMGLFPAPALADALDEGVDVVVVDETTEEPEEVSDVDETVSVGTPDEGETDASQADDSESVDDNSADDVELVSSLDETTKLESDAEPISDLQKTIAFGRAVSGAVEQSGQLTIYTFALEHQTVVRVNLMWEPGASAATRFDAWGFDTTSYTSSFKEDADFSQGFHTFEAKLEAGEHSFAVSANEAMAYEVELEDVSVYVESLDVPDFSLMAGETANVSATITPSNATVKNLIYNCSNPAIATVDESGLVTGLKGGIAEITVSDVISGASTTTEVKVKTPTIDATNQDRSATIQLGETSYGVVGGLNDVNYTFTLDKPAVVELNLVWQDGTTYGPAIRLSEFDTSYGEESLTFSDYRYTTTAKLGAGTHTVRVSGYGTTPYELTLVDDSVYVASVSGKDASLFYGKTAKVSYSLTPSDANVKSIKFSSSNTSVAKVSSAGIVTGVKPGKATVTVKDAVSGNLKKITVTVKAATIKRGKGATKSAYTISLFGKKTLSVTSNLTSAKLTWKSSNTAVATVNSKGVVVAKKAGKATISVKPTYGNTIKWTITVPKVKATKVKVATIANREFTDKAQSPALNIKYQGKTLKKGTDYTVKFSNNKNIGTAKATITFKGSYTGKLTKTFKIVAPKVGKPVFTYWERDGTYSYVECDRGTNATGIHLKITGGGWPTYEELISGPDGWGECGKKSNKLKVTYNIRSYKKVGSKIFYSDWVSKTF